MTEEDMRALTEFLASRSFNMHHVKKCAIEASLIKTGWNKTRAAVLLQVSIRWLRDWVRKYEI